MFEEEVANAARRAALQQQRERVVRAATVVGLRLPAGRALKGGIECAVVCLRRVLLRRILWDEVLEPPGGGGAVGAAANAACATGPPPASTISTGTHRAVRVWIGPLATPRGAAPLRFGHFVPWSGRGVEM